MTAEARAAHAAYTRPTTPPQRGGTGGGTVPHISHVSHTLHRMVERNSLPMRGVNGRGWYLTSLQFGGSRHAGGPHALARIARFRRGGGRARRPLSPRRYLLRRVKCSQSRSGSSSRVTSTRSSSSPSAQCAGEGVRVCVHALRPAGAASELTLPTGPSRVRERECAGDGVRTPLQTPPTCMRLRPRGMGRQGG
jgi:hypothetical protein